MLRDASRVLDHDRSELVRRARRTRLVLTDVDGVLTDAGVYYSSRGEEMKRFSLRDGMGVELLRAAGIETGLVTREQSEIVSARAKKLGIHHVYLGVTEKREFVVRKLKELEVDLRELAYIGDDVNDAPLLALVSEYGLTATPADAIADARRSALLNTVAAGGHGAFREFTDFILELRRKEMP